MNNHDLPRNAVYSTFVGAVYATKEKIINWAKALYNRLLESYRVWSEWEDAKAWIYASHPGWVHIATRAKSEETRQKYRDKIMLAYLGECDDGNEELRCNQLCQWNDSSDGCVKPIGRICPMENAKVDASGWRQANMPWCR